MADMTDISPGMVPEEDAHIQQALDSAVEVLEGESDALASAKRRVSDALRKATREAPLHSLAIAFLLGVLIARRR
jgi:ElaB/YqjD/DUF883 family membrane-anchored ribosome-binding protein